MKLEEIMGSLLINKTAIERLVMSSDPVPGFIGENRPFGTLDWTEKIKKAYGWREPQKRGRPWPKGKEKAK